MQSPTRTATVLQNWERIRKFAVNSKNKTNALRAGIGIHISNLEVVFSECLAGPGAKSMFMNQIPPEKEKEMSGELQANKRNHPTGSSNPLDQG